MFAGRGAGWLLAPPIAFLVLLLLVPVGLLIELAVTEGGFDGLLSDSIFRASLVRTVFMATAVALLALVIGTFFALAIAAASRPVAVLLVISLFSLFWTSILVRSYGWLLLYLPKGPIFDLLSTLGLRDDPLKFYQTTYAPYPAMVHVMLPYVVLPVWAAVRQIDPDHLRASRTLGAGPWLTLRKVILPQLRSGIIAGAVLVFVMSLGFYVTPKMLGSPSQPTVAGLIGFNFGFPDGLPRAAAMSLILLAVVIVIYLAADRAFKVSEQWGSE
jgi:putative spermidine/putrescine transport system permease protein